MRNQNFVLLLSRVPIFIPYRMNLHKADFDPVYVYLYT